MKSRNILIFALIMAVVTTLLFNNYMKNLESKYKKAQNKVTVVVAKQSIKENQRVTKEMLELKEISADAVLPEAVKKMEDVIGKYAIVDIRQDEMLMPFRFTNQFEETQLITRKIRDGYRAVSIEVNYVESVSNLIQPEDDVDVVYTENNKQENGKSTANAEVVLENVRVLAVGSRLNVKEPQASADNKGEAQQKQADHGVEYTAVTLELKTEDAVKLISDDASGNIKLLLRSKVLP